MEKNNYSIIDVLFGIFVAGAALLLSRFLIESVNIESIFTGLRNSAFVIMGFIVAAFNLRFKLADLIGTGQYSVKEQRKLGRIIQSKINNINFILILFVITAAAAGFSSLVGTLWYLTNPIIELSFVLFAISVYSFILILISFNDVENFKIEINQRSAERNEAERLLKKLSDKNRSDNSFNFSIK